MAKAPNRQDFTIVAIDLRRLQASRVCDISTEEGRLAHGIRKGSTAWRFTSDCAEVAIAGHVPMDMVFLRALVSYNNRARTHAGFTLLGGNAVARRGRSPIPTTVPLGAIRRTRQT